MRINACYRKIIAHQTDLIQYQRKQLEFPQLIALRTANSKQLDKIGVLERQLSESRIRGLETTRKLKELEQELEKIKKQLGVCQQDLQATKWELKQYQTPVSSNLLHNRTPLVSSLSFFHSRNISKTKISDLFVCPLTQEVISNPAVAADGITYEESAIRQWLYNYKKDTSPMNRSKLSNKNLIPNQTIIDAQDKFLLKLIIVCPLNNTVMEEPVIAADGYTYEKEAIEAWFKQKAISPMTNKPVPNTTLLTNQSIKSIIMDYKSPRLDIQTNGSSISRIG